MRFTAWLNVYGPQCSRSFIMLDSHTTLPTPSPLQLAGGHGAWRWE
jgi:hypothetical protein